MSLYRFCQQTPTVLSLQPSAGCSRTGLVFNNLPNDRTQYGGQRRSLARYEEKNLSRTRSIGLIGLSNVSWGEVILQQPTWHWIGLVTITFRCFCTVTNVLMQLWKCWWTICTLIRNEQLADFFAILDQKIFFGDLFDCSVMEIQGGYPYWLSHFTFDI